MRNFLKNLSDHRFSDASYFGWGYCSYWDEDDQGRAFIVKEIQALRLTLENLLHRFENTRVDVFVDNKAVVSC